ncbi:MAG TPA: pilus assembly protein TadG-related protein [Candidatus Acidoferrales bacterium]|nr:pilus assembly protein TadG-related protein [Candidatus Acidoferrales bacterium]
MKRKREAGQALVFTAVGLVVLMGFAGLAIDMGVMRYEKRLQQTAADAAAIAGANNLPYGGVTVGAQDAAATDGFADTGASCSTGCPNPGSVGYVTVTVNNPPLSGPHATKAGYVEVLVTDIHPTYFMRVLGVNTQAITARAVATDISGGTGSGCLYTLGPPNSSIEGVSINGSAILNATTCGIVDNGDFNTKGNKLIVNADTFGIAGGPNQSGPGGTVTCTAPGPCPALNMPAATDPLAGTPSPCTQGYSCTGGTALSVPSSGGTIDPGTYSSITITGGTVTFNPGVYVITGSPGGGGCPSDCLVIPGNSTISGSGVMFYFTNDATIDMTGTPTINLSPPTSGTYAGMLMYQDPADTSNTAPNGPRLGGDTGSSFTGALYFPSDNLTFFGNNTSFSVGMVVTDSFSLSGNPTVNLTGDVGLGPGVGLVKNAVLVE